MALSSKQTGINFYHQIPGSPFDANLDIIELFVAYSHNPENVQLNDDIFKYYTDSALRYFDLISSQPGNLGPEYIAFNALLFDRMSARERQYGVSFDELNKIIREEGYDVLLQRYPLPQNVISAQPVDFLPDIPGDALAIISENDLGVLASDESDRKQLVISYLPVYESTFLQRLERVKQKYKITHKIDMKEVTQLFMYLGAIACLQITPYGTEPESKTVTYLLSMIPNRLFLLPIESVYPGLNSALYALVENVYILPIPPIKITNGNGEQLCSLRQFSVNLDKVNNYVTTATLTDVDINRQIYYNIFRDANLTSRYRELFVYVLWVLIYEWKIANFAMLDNDQFVRGILQGDFYTDILPLANSYSDLILTPGNIDNAIRLITAVLPSAPMNTGQTFQQYVEDLDVVNLLQQEYDNSLSNAAPTIPDVYTFIVSALYFYTYVKNYWLL